MFRTENNQISVTISKTISILALITVFLAVNGTFGAGIAWGPSVSYNPLWI